MSRAPGCGVCLKSMLETITLQYFDKVNEALKHRSIVPGHGVCLKSMSKAITVQNFTLQAITAAEIHT